MTTLTERLNRWLFGRAVREMATTPPVSRGSQPFAVLSMVQHRDVLPYLLAVKSFCHHARPERVVLVADPTLDELDRELLRQHVPSLEIYDAARFRRAALPTGGTWERLSAISVLCSETSVVQLDADTVTLDTPSEVVEAATSDRTFILRSEAGVEIVSLEEAASTGRHLQQRSSHIQAVTEARLLELPAGGSFRYARGCSGFTGFGRGAIGPDRLDAVSSMMRSLHGSRWDEWGTEQVTSNLLAASVEGASMLPHPRYCNADSKNGDTVLAHYIGYARFMSRDYERAVAHVAQVLRTS
jgi:hypothetical protein